MRLFIAAELTDSLMEALAETQAQLRECVKGRFCAPDTFHVTLAFLGDVASSSIDDIEDALRCGASGAKAINVQLGEYGSFGRRSDATLWQGLDDGGRLAKIAMRVRSELDTRDISYDAKPFRPHITLMRRADMAKGVLPMPIRARGKVSRITLFQSELSPQGPRYMPLYTYELSQLPS